MRPQFGFLGAAAVILAAAALCFGRAARNEALPEDDLAVWGNPAVTAPGLAGACAGQFYDSRRYGLRPAVRPLPVLWHRIEWRVFREQRAGYIWARAALAALCAGALLRVLRESGLGWRFAASGSLLFLAHPLTARSVFSLAGSADLLALLFGTVSASLFLRESLSGPDPPRRVRPRRWLASAILLLLAALSHEMAFALGAALLLGWLWGKDVFHPGPGGGRAPFAIAWALALALAYRTAVWLTLPHHLRIGPAVESASGIPWLMRLLSGLAAVPEVLRQLVFPWRLPYQHDFVRFLPGVWPRAGLGLILLVSLVVIVFRLRRGDRAAATWGLFALLACAGVCGLIVPTGSLLPARPLLFVVAGTVVLVFAGARQASRIRWARVGLGAPRAKAIASVCAFLVFCLFAIRTIHLGVASRSWESMVSRQVAEFPRSPQSWFDRGNLDLTRGRPAEAIRHYERALEVWPEFWAAWVNLGTAYGAMDETGLAVRSFDRAIAGTRGSKALRTVEARAQFNRALMLMKQSRNVEAAEGFENMLEVFPDHLVAHANLGLIYSNSEHLDEKSTTHLNRALEMETDPRRRQLLEDCLEGIRKRRARLERDRQREEDAAGFGPDEPGFRGAPAAGPGEPSGEEMDPSDSSVPMGGSAPESR